MDYDQSGLLRCHHPKKTSNNLCHIHTLSYGWWPVWISHPITANPSLLSPSFPSFRTIPPVSAAPWNPRSEAPRSRKGSHRCHRPGGGSAGRLIDSSYPQVRWARFGVGGLTWSNHLLRSWDTRESTPHVKTMVDSVTQRRRVVTLVSVSTHISMSHANWNSSNLEVNSTEDSPKQF